MIRLENYGGELNMPEMTPFTKTLFEACAKATYASALRYKEKMMITDDTTYQVNVLCESGKQYTIGKDGFNRLDQLVLAVYHAFSDKDDVAISIIITKHTKGVNNDNP